ncbi:hypothetical protein PFICI_08609 [Pestalotiopsis fici W106-1]|uniref:N-acetyltransferase domain-containing protein n=1 Tax=Pestalotiopsis fici (strain W106-1 / CGMCC3.15140) TaxID=1229662 RepID=W3X0U0_PESFW|nr:uncharacterized protein PFICI_08609 [Pestalotiopsis fici W106-1]ETS78756.1 hypothetical protein PFICI_08609 [Pestalotiopsis fici W106-1]
MARLTKDVESVTVEEARHTDIDAIAEIGIESLPLQFDDKVPRWFTDFAIEKSFGKDAVARALDKQLRTTLVARSGNEEVIGFAQIIRDCQCPHRPYDQASRITLNKLYVKEGFRGCGVGGKLMEAVENLVMEEGHRAVWLLVYEGNETARSLYTKRGWKTTVPIDFELRGQRFRDWVLEKKFDCDGVPGTKWSVEPEWILDVYAPW